MDEFFPWLVFGCGLYLSVLLNLPKLEIAYRQRHPLGDRLARSRKAARWLLFIGALWSLQNLLLGR